MKITRKFMSRLNSLALLCICISNVSDKLWYQVLITVIVLIAIAFNILSYIGLGKGYKTKGKRLIKVLDTDEDLLVIFLIGVIVNLGVQNWYLFWACLIAFFIMMLIEILPIGNKDI